MRTLVVYLATCGLAALVPLLPRPGERPQSAPVAFPASFEGRPLHELPLGERDRRFARDFPGRIGLYSDGRRQIVLRYITRATRRVHPIADCLKAVGYAIEPRPARRGPDGTTWSCLSATRKDERLEVCEQLRDAAGATWPDPSTWYWPALVGASRGPWWSTTIVEAQSVR